MSFLHKRYFLQETLVHPDIVTSVLYRPEAQQFQIPYTEDILSILLSHEIVMEYRLHHPCPTDRATEIWF
jgi:hypothetical protein